MSLNKDQMFFVGFAQFYCSVYSAKDMSYILKFDEHAPDSVRVMASVANHPEFAKVFQCPKKSPMYLDEASRCKLW